MFLFHSKIWCLPTVLLILLLAVTSLQAQPPTPASPLPAQTGQPRTLRVATRIISPFVMEGKDKGKLEGFSMDLWNSIADEMNVQSTFITRPNVKTLLSTVQSGQADLGISAISITSERESQFDFSQPMFDSGLQILVRDETGGNSAPSLLSAFSSPELRQLLGVVLLIVLVPAHIVWFFERRQEDGIIENKKYFPGIFKAIWWSAGTLGAQADEMPKSIIGRVVALFWMFSGIAFVAYFTAVLTAAMTVSQLQGDINGPDDLPGKRVATTTGSTSAKYLREHNSKVLEFPQIDAAYDALLNKKADAVVFDSPVLLYYAVHEGKGKTQVVGTIFRKEDYGIVFPPNSPYLERVNNALLAVKENGTYQELYDKWFSSD